MFFKRIFFALIFGVMLVGCQTEPDDELLPLVIPAKPQVWTVQVSDAAEGVNETFKSCDEAIPGVSLLIVEGASQETLTTSSDFLFASDWLIFPEAAAYLLYEEAFIVITHADNPVNSLTIAQLQDIFSGRISNWIDIDHSSYRGEIIRFGYPDGSDLQGAFEQSLKEDVRGQKYLVPDPEAMLVSVSDTPYAIGFLPEWAVDESVNIVEIEDGELRFQLVVYSRVESEQSLNWLGCLHSEMNR